MFQEKQAGMAVWTSDEVVRHFVVRFDLKRPRTQTEFIDMSDRLSKFGGAISLDKNMTSGIISMSIAKESYEDVVYHIEQALIDTFEDEYYTLLIDLEMFV